MEVIHEALIRHWPRLRRWLDEGRSALRLRQSLSNEALQWEAAERADGLVPRWSSRLEEAQRLAQNPRFALNQLERAYLDACIALRDREAAEKEAQRQRELEQAQELATEQHQRAEEQVHLPPVCANVLCCWPLLAYWPCCWPWPQAGLV